MKKLLMILAVAIATMVGGSALFAQETASSSSDNYFTVKALIEDDLFDNKALILTKSDSLSKAEKVNLYDDSKKNPWLAFGLNLAVGFGIGSFVNGDKKGGTTQLVGQILGGAFVGLGYGLQFASVMLARGAFSGGNYSESDYMVAEILYATGVGVIVGGAILISAYQIYGIVRAFTFTNSYNDTLKQSLGITSTDISLLPVVDVVNKNYGVAATVRL